MSIRTMDGFDHYGGLTARALEGWWSQLESSVSIATANPRNGTHALRINMNGSSTATARHPLGAALVTAGVGFGHFVPTLPTSGSQHVLAEFRDAANAAQVQFLLGTTGTIKAYRGDFVTLLGESGQVFVGGSYQHVEFKVTISDTVGVAACKVNGVSALNLTAQDTKATANTETSQLFHGTRGGGGGSGAGNCDFDDWFTWDDQGAQNNDFIGDKRVLFQALDGDTAATDWVRSGGSNDFDMIKEAAPDDDTTYISAANLNDISEFSIADLAGGASGIAAIMLFARMKKTDAGAANVQMSILSGASVGAGADRAITTGYAYYKDISELDPATSAAWAAAGFNAALKRIERTA